MGEERRKAQRTRTYRPVRLRIPGTLHVIETLTRDLTADGMRCLSPSVVPVDTDVEIELKVAAGEELVFRGQAVWFRTIPESEQFDLGISFHDIPTRDKRRLSACLDRLSRHLTPA